MATDTLRSRFSVPSPLAVDLAKARVDLAALRARRGLELGQQALDAAELLKDYYSRQLQAAKSPVPIIPEKLVKDKETREALQKGLGSIFPPRLSLDETTAQSASELVDLLSTIADSGDFGPEEGKQLHKLLHNLEPKPARRSSSSKLAKLSESLDAFS